MPKSIRASVGQAGANVSVDVMTIQYLLNCVPASDGGPLQELAVDGYAGPRTNAALARFQQARLGWSDGRVDPSGQTLPMLLSYDPFPNAPFTPPHHHQAKAAKHGGKLAGKDWIAPQFPDPPGGKLSPPAKVGWKMGGGGKLSGGGSGGKLF